MNNGSTELQIGYYDDLLKVGRLNRDEGLEDEVAARVLEIFLDTLPINAKVLEAGTGAGIEAAIIEKSGKKAYFVDLSIRMLKKTRTNLQERSRKKITQADIFKLPFADETFEAVISKDVISLGGITERQNIIEELKRVLKPHGKLLLMAEEIPETIVTIDGQKKRGAILKLAAQVNNGGTLESIQQIEVHQTLLETMLQDMGFNDIEGKTLMKNGARWVNNHLVIVQGIK